MDSTSVAHAPIPGVAPPVAKPTLLMKYEEAAKSLDPPETLSDLSDLSDSDESLSPPSGTAEGIAHRRDLLQTIMRSAKSLDDKLDELAFLAGTRSEERADKPGEIKIKIATPPPSPRLEPSEVDNNILSPLVLGEKVFRDESSVSSETSSSSIRPASSASSASSISFTPAKAVLMTPPRTPERDEIFLSEKPALLAVSVREAAPMRRPGQPRGPRSLPETPPKSPIAAKSDRVVAKELPTEQTDATGLENMVLEPPPRTVSLGVPIPSPPVSAPLDVPSKLPMDVVLAQPAVFDTPKPTYEGQKSNPERSIAGSQLVTPIFPNVTPMAKKAENPPVTATSGGTVLTAPSVSSGNAPPARQVKRKPKS